MASGLQTAMETRRDKVKISSKSKNVRKYAPYVTRPSSNGSQVSVMSMDSIDVF